MRRRLERAAAPLAALPHVWRASRGPFLLLSAFLLLQGLAGPATVLLLGDTVGSFSRGTFTADLPRLATFWGLLTAVSLTTFPIVFSLSGRLNEDLTTYLQELLLHRGTTLKTMELFDDPDAYDIVSLVVREAKSRPVNYIVLYSYILRSGISLISYAIILWTFAWYIPLLMLVAAIPLHRAFTSLREANWVGIRQRAHTARFLDYLVALFLQRETAMETRAHGMQGLIHARFASNKTEMLADLRGHRHRGLLKNAPGIAIGVALYVASIVLLLINADTAGMAVAGLAAGVQAFSSMQQASTEVVENLAYLNEKAFFFKDLNRLLAFRESTLPEGAQEASPSPAASPSLAAFPSPAEAAPSPVGQPPSAVIEFRDVSFTYPSAQKPAIDAMSFSVADGETVAIVGKNGAGKSTLLKLVCGFYGPTAGVVLCDGVALDRDGVDIWRESVSPIFQSTSAFAMTFGQNVTLGRDVPDALIAESMRAAYGADAPRSLDEELGVEFGGTELSGGELQRLGLARAIAKDSRVVILDEPTSAIDPIFEAEVFASIKEFVRDRTALIVTHRMPQALAADRVLVIEDGRVVESGAPRDLVAGGGIFADMVQAQSSPFLADE
ncbi:MAG: ABC transporter ATP-binding protein [Dermabacter sp.]|nr:ABC transporter ATP-binding protein [Dermabacter sp.]